MTKSNCKYLTSIFIATFSLPLFGAGRDVIMKTFMVSNEKSSSEPTQSATQIRVRIKVKCAGANLRYIANPLARDGYLVPQIILTTPNNVRRVFTLDPAASGGRKIPGWLANSSTLTADQINEIDYSFPCESAEDTNCAAGTASAYRTVNARYGYLTANLPIDADDLGNIWINPDNNISHPKIKVEFIQHLAQPRVWSEYRGHAGHLTYSQSDPQWDANGREVKITATFFGEEGYCGGYHSPLVMYFDEGRSEYTGIANFNLFGSPGLVYWPEKTSKAHFLAMDRNKNGKIDSQKELFGNVVGSHSNGFKVLSELDENHDGVIDQKDPQFKKLLLWHDSTGEGKCLKKDLLPLAKKGVRSISLKYTSFIRPFGARAEERAEASFYFDPSPNSKHAGKELKEGKVIDVWFARPTILPSH